MLLPTGSKDKLGIKPSTFQLGRYTCAPTNPFVRGKSCTRNSICSLVALIHYIIVIFLHGQQLGVWVGRLVTLPPFHPSTLPLIHYRISSFNSSDLLGCEMNNLKRPLLRTFVSHLPGNLKEDGILQIKLLIPVLQAWQGGHGQAARQRHAGKTQRPKLGEAFSSVHG